MLPLGLAVAGGCPVAQDPVVGTWKDALPGGKSVALALRPDGTGALTLPGSAGVLPLTWERANDDDDADEDVALYVSKAGTAKKIRLFGDLQDGDAGGATLGLTLQPLGKDLLAVSLRREK